MKARVDGSLNERAVGVECPVCQVPPGDACKVNFGARPYPSTIKIGWGDRFHSARSNLAEDRRTP